MVLHHDRYSGSLVLDMQGPNHKTCRRRCHYRATSVVAYAISITPLVHNSRPQENAIVERVHQIFGHILGTFQVENMHEENPWKGFLSEMAFPVQVTVHTITKAIATQLVFRTDCILQVRFQANCKLIKDRKERIIPQNNQRENSKCLPQIYHVGDEVLFKQDQKAKFGLNPKKSPYIITKVRSNGTVRIREVITEDTYNMRRITPYKSGRVRVQDREPWVMVLSR